MADISRVVGQLFASASARPAWQRYGLAVVLPTVAFMTTASFAERSSTPLLPPFMFAVILTSIFGSTGPGMLALAYSVLLNVVALSSSHSLQITRTGNAVLIILFAAFGALIVVIIGSTGALQRKLDGERERLRVTLRSIGDAVIATDAAGRITFLNPAAEQATGWTWESAFGQDLVTVFHIINEKTRERVVNPVEKVFAEGGVVGLANHTVLVRKDGREIPIEDSAAPILIRGQLVGVVLIFRDVTQARQTQAALQTSEKLASVGRLAATIAHEINNPLEAVTNFLYLIDSEHDLARIRQFAEAGQRELARASHACRQTLSFARSSDKREFSSLATLSDETLHFYDSRMKSKDISVVTRYRGEATVLVSRNEVRQVIANLLANAIDAQDGGRLHIRVSALPSAGLAHLTLADQGSGIPPSHLPRIFTPFFTTKDQLGTGLGLWVTKGIVEAHGGSIRVRSRAGQGTVFSISLPLASPVTERPHLSMEKSA